MNQQVTDFQNMIDREGKLNQLIERAEELQVHRSSLDFVHKRRKDRKD